MNAFIRLLYALLIAASVVTFVGVGIFSVYQPPKGPEFPAYSSSEASFSQWNKANQAFRPKEQAYQRNVAIISLAAAVVILAASLYVGKGMGVVSEGLSLGAVGTSLYAVITASIGDGRLLRFLGVALFLVSAIVVAQRRFAVETATAKK